MYTLAELVQQVLHKRLEDRMWRIRLIMPRLNDFPDVYLFNRRWIIVMTDDAVRRIVTGDDPRYEVTPEADFRTHRPTVNESDRVISGTSWFTLDPNAFMKNPDPSFFILDPATGDFHCVELTTTSSLATRGECHIVVPDKLLESIRKAWRVEVALPAG